VFDVDDTLYLERDYVRTGFVAVDRLLRSRFGVVGFLDAALALSPAWNTSATTRRGSVIDQALHAVGVSTTPGLIVELVATYRTHRPDIALLADARSALDRTRAEAVAVAVVTDGPLWSQRAKCAALGLAAWAEPIVLTAEWCPDDPKPSTVPFSHVERVRGVRPEDCVYVADNPDKDFEGPSRLGWTTIRVRRPHSLHGTTASGPDVDAEVTSLRELWQVVAPAPRNHGPCVRMGGGLESL
jgi:putative hydrolase of the HAD superfamily